MKHTSLCATAVLMALAATACGKKDADEHAAAPAPYTTPPASTAPATPDQPMTPDQVDVGQDMDAKVADVDIGRSLNPDNSIGDKTQSFKPHDTVYVSVKTKADGPAAKLETMVTAKGDGALVKKFEQDLAAGEQVYEFHLSSADGLKPGEYKVETLINGDSVDTQDFKVDAS